MDIPVYRSTPGRCPSSLFLDQRLLKCLTKDVTLLIPGGFPFPLSGISPFGPQVIPLDGLEGKGSEVC